MSPRRYTPIPPQVDLPAMEREILELWHREDTFAKTLAQTEQGEPWTFYEGPPTANGQPGVHHVEARVFKDVFPRFKTMQGRHVVRKAGWDCHGLPVEIAVEKELGFSGKGDIEAYGVAEFNQKCRESVERHVDEFTAMTLRMGYWVDMTKPYRTMDTPYIESVWWSLKQVFERGLLVQDHRVAPYCPRCGTGLSDHELAQGYETVVDPSVYVRFPLTSGPYAGKASLLVWTTTPWTLVSNTAVAVRPDVTYVTARNETTDELLVVAEPLVGSALGEGWQVVDRFSGQEMEHWSYERPFDLVDWPRGRARPLRRAGRLRHHRRRHRTRAPGPGVRRRGPRGQPRLRPAGRQPGAPGRPLPGLGAARRRAVLQDCRRRAGRGPEGARPAVPAGALRARLPALLALPHGAALLRAAVLVHPDHRDQGRSCSTRTSAPTGSPRPSSTAATATG